jgi:hypothetical protein
MPPSIRALAQADVQAIVVPAAKTSNFTSAAIDLLDYEGIATVRLQSAKGSGHADNTLDVKVTHSDTSGGTYTDVAGATFAQVLGTGGTDSCQEIAIDVSTVVKRYIKLVSTIAGTTPSFVMALSVAGMKKYR